MNFNKDLVVPEFEPEGNRTSDKNNSANSNSTSGGKRKLLKMSEIDVTNIVNVEFDVYSESEI